MDVFSRNSRGLVICFKKKNPPQQTYVMKIFFGLLFSRIFYSYGDVIIASEGCKKSKEQWCFFSMQYLMWHRTSIIWTCPSSRVIHTCCSAFGSWIVTIHFNGLGLSRTPVLNPEREREWERERKRERESERERERLHYKPVFKFLLLRLRMYVKISIEKWLAPVIKQKFVGKRSNALLICLCFYLLFTY